MINLDLEKQITAQIEQTIRDYIVGSALQEKIQQQVDAAVSSVIDKVAGKVYQDVVNKKNIADTINRIVQSQAAHDIQDQSATQVRLELAKTPVKDIVHRLVKQQIDVKIDSLDFPEKSIKPSAIDWQTGSLSGFNISGGTITKFNSTGIDDRATTCQLTVMDDNVVVERDFVATNITAVENITAHNISLTGTLEIGTEILDHGPFSQMIQMHSQMMIEQALEPYQALLHEGAPIVSLNAIAPSVTQSNIRKLGNLQELNVLGDAKFSETLFISSGGKVGINTEEPRGALTIWDEDAEVTFARTGRRTMFIGSTRNSDIEIGTNNQNQMIFKEENIDINTPIRIMGVRFSVVNSIPEHSGEPNEIVMVNTAKEGQPLFYICKGNNKWQSLSIS